MMERPATPYELTHNRDGSQRLHTSIGSDGRITRLNKEDAPWIHIRDQGGPGKGLTNLLMGNEFVNTDPYERKDQGLIPSVASWVKWPWQFGTQIGGELLYNGPRRSGLLGTAGEALRPSGWGKDWFRNAARRAWDNKTEMTEDGRSVYNRVFQRMAGDGDGVRARLTSLLGSVGSFTAPLWAKYEKPQDHAGDAPQ